MSEIKRQHLQMFRYTYLMIGSVALIALLVVLALLNVQHADQQARDRISLFHLKSSSLAQELRRDAQTLTEIIYTSNSIEPTAAVAGVSRLTPDRRSQLEIMQSAIQKLNELQDEYKGKAFEMTLGRVDARMQDVMRLEDSARPFRETRDAIGMLELSAYQLARLHAAAADKSLEELEASSGHHQPFYVATAAIILLILISTWLTTRLVRASLRREAAAAKALADSREQLHHMQKLDALGQLVGGIAHDFNNLLTAILGHSGRLKKIPYDEADFADGLEQIHKGASEAANLTRQLLAFSRMQPVEMKVFSVNELLEDTENMLKRMIGEDVQFDCRLEKGLPPVEMDPTQLRQVILNLAGNARDAMPRGGRLRISTSSVILDGGDQGPEDLPAGDYVRIVVSDTGVGMTEATAARIFEPFFTTKPMGRGTGLGLSTVHGIIRAADGRTSVDSKLGQGTVFEVLLPASQKPVVSIHDSRDKFDEEPGSETVLVVEDEEMIRNMLQVGLAHYGYRVLLAESAEKGLELCSGDEGEIDVLVSDVIMPGTNGADFVRQARRLQPRATCILMSGYTDNVLEDGGMDIGDIPLIQKPFEIERMAALIRSTLESSP